MTHRQLNRIKLAARALSILCIVGTLSVVINAVLIKRPVLPDVSAPRDQEAAHEARGVDIPELSQLSAIWERDLRQTLIEPPKPPAPKAEPPPRPKPVSLPRLVATFVEQGQAWGIFTGLGKGTRVLPVGAQFGSFEIIRIDTGSAKLRTGGRDYEIEVPKEDLMGNQGRGTVSRG